MKKFYAVVGNPPFQEDSVGDNESYEPPIYNLFSTRRTRSEIGLKWCIQHGFYSMQAALRKRGTAKCCRILI